VGRELLPYLTGNASCLVHVVIICVALPGGAAGGGRAGRRGVVLCSSALSG
jgi:hypothetical protein